MSDFFKIGLLVYILYLPIFLLLLIYGARKKYRRYSVLTFWVSNLGEERAASHYIFNVCFLIFAFLNLFFLKGLFEIMPDLILSKIALYFFALSIVALILIVFLPMDKRPKVHQVIASSLFIGMSGFILFSIYPVYVSEVLPRFLVLLNVIILIFVSLTAFTFKKLLSKYGAPALTDLVGERKKENSLLLKNATLWEWATFVSSLLWFFVSAIFIYGGL